MFSQKEGGFAGATVIAEGVKVEGNFKGEGPMVIDGEVKGTIVTNHSVEVGKSATIEANVRADSVVVGGFVRGNIIAKSRVELLAGSRVEGDVATMSLVIAEGASFNGKCAMGATKNDDAENADPSRETKAKATKTS